MVPFFCVCVGYITSARTSRSEFVYNENSIYTETLLSLGDANYNFRAFVARYNAGAIQQREFNVLIHRVLLEQQRSFSSSEENQFL